jgi:hypothetical protein
MRSKQRKKPCLLALALERATVKNPADRSVVIYLFLGVYAALLRTGAATRPSAEAARLRLLLFSTCGVLMKPMKSEPREVVEQGFEREKWG